MRKFLIFFASLIFLVCLANSVNAANGSLYLYPNSENHKIGDTFLVQIRLNSDGTSINSADGKLTFDTNKLQVISVSKDGSIFTLWVQEPTFSNSNGKIEFAGGKPSPGFIGTAGKVATITFKAKSSGKANVTFNSGSIFADDGIGTNVLTSMENGSYQISDEETIPIPEPDKVLFPSISSPTHPDSEKWYSDSSPKFIWKTYLDMTGTRLLFDRFPSSLPTIFYSEEIFEKKLEGLTDGIWYFHVQLRDQNGWGIVDHFKFQIDTQPPERFKIQIKQDALNVQPTITFETKDELSGIDHYEIMIDQQEPILTDKTEYKLSFQNPGKRKIIVKALDKAENYTLAMAEVEILPIETPIITDYPHDLIVDSFLTIRGTALPEVTVKVYLQKIGETEPKIEETKSDLQGNWLWTGSQLLKIGDYQVWVEAIDSQGAKSEPSPKIKIAVSPAPFLKIGGFNFNFSSTIIILLIFVIIFITIMFIILLKKKRKKEKIKKGLSDVEKTLYQSFKKLKGNIEKQVAKLDGKPGLNEKEKEICQELKKTLKNCEKLIKKEVDQLEEKIK